MISPIHRFFLGSLACILLLGLVAAAELRAEGEPAPKPTIDPQLAEAPHWPIGLMYPEDYSIPRRGRPRPEADGLVWLPPDDKPIRALLLVPNNTDSKNFIEHSKLREVAAKHGMAIVYFRRGVYTMNEAIEGQIGGTQEILDYIATLTGRSEFRHAPWIAFGKSSTSRYPFWMPWAHPERTLASISYQGEVPWWPMRDWAKPQTHTVTYLVVNGEDEWSNTWYRHVRPNLLNYRNQTAWLPHQVVAAGVGHGNYADAHGSAGWGKPVEPGVVSVLVVWDYMALFIDKTLTLRLPEKGVPTDGPIKLREIDPSKGYLIHPRAVETLLETRWRPLRRNDEGRYTIVDHVQEPGQVFASEQGSIDRDLLIRAYKDVPEAERKQMFWVADKEQADAWVKLHTIRARAAAADKATDSE